MRTAAMRQKQIHATRINWKISVSSARLNDFFDVLDDELGWRLIAPAAICTHLNFLKFRRVHWLESTLQPRETPRQQGSRPVQKYFQKSEKRLVSFLNFQ